MFGKHFAFAVSETSRKRERRNEFSVIRHLLEVIASVRSGGFHESSGRNRLLLRKPFRRSRFRLVLPVRSNERSATAVPIMSDLTPFWSPAIHLKEQESNFPNRPADCHGSIERILIGYESYPANS